MAWFLQVPKVTFMDLYVFPTSTLEVSYTESVGAVIHAPETEIHGSHHVESLNCNDRCLLPTLSRMDRENALCMYRPGVTPPVLMRGLCSGLR